MANLLRFYVDKKILDEPDENGLLGGDHSRVIDVGNPIPGEDPDPRKAREHVEAMLEDDEAIGSSNGIVVDYPGDLEVEWI